MASIPVWFTLSGLMADIAGFCLIGWHLRKHPKDWLMWHGGTKGHHKNLLGFFLIIGGFVLQAVAQGITLTN